MLGPADCAADCRLFPVAYAGSYQLFCYDRRGRATGAADGDITGRGVSWALQRSSPSPLRGSHATASLELEGHFCRAATSLCRGPASDGAAAGKAALELQRRVRRAGLVACRLGDDDAVPRVVPVKEGVKRGWRRLMVRATNRAEALPEMRRARTCRPQPRACHCSTSIERLPCFLFRSSIDASPSANGRVPDARLDVSFAFESSQERRWSLAFSTRAGGGRFRAELGTAKSRRCVVVAGRIQTDDLPDDTPHAHSANSLPSPPLVTRHVGLWAG